MACDESLYRQYLNGDDEGLNALMKKYGDPLTLYIDGYLHDVHEAEELMLDVFAYLFTKKPRIRDGGFKAYLYKAARHMALRHMRTRFAAASAQRPSLYCLKRPSRSVASEPTGWIRFLRKSGSMSRAPQTFKAGRQLSESTYIFGSLTVKRWTS